MERGDFVKGFYLGAKTSPVTTRVTSLPLDTTGFFPFLVYSVHSTKIYTQNIELAIFGL